MKMFMHCAASLILFPLIEPEQSTTKTNSAFVSTFASNDGKAEMQIYPSDATAQLFPPSVSFVLINIASAFGTLSIETV